MNFDFYSGTIVVALMVADLCSPETTGYLFGMGPLRSKLGAIDYYRVALFDSRKTRKLFEMIYLM